jgi:hypothetical protein
MFSNSELWWDGIAATSSGISHACRSAVSLRIEGPRLSTDQWLAARLFGTGTHTGTFRGIAATGRGIRRQELVIATSVLRWVENAAPERGAGSVRGVIRRTNNPGILFAVHRGYAITDAPPTEPAYVTATKVLT